MRMPCDVRRKIAWGRPSGGGAPFARSAVGGALLRRACMGKVPSLRALEASPFLAIYLFLGFRSGLARNGARVHCVRVDRGETQSCGIRARPLPAAAVRVAAVVVVPGLRRGEDVSQRLLAHPVASLLLGSVLPFLECVRGVDVDNGFGERESRMS